MLTKEKLEVLANRLMFEMKEEEYNTLLDEFDIILKQMDYIDKIEDIDSVSPMTFPFDLNLDDSYLREDEFKLQKEEVNAVRYYSIEELRKQDNKDYTFCNWDEEGFNKQIELLKKYRKKVMNIK